MAARKNIINDIEMFLAKTFPNITDRQQGSPAAKSRAAAAKKLAAKRKEVLKRNSAEGPKRSVARKTNTASKITRRPMESGNKVTISTPKKGTRTSYRGTVSTSKGRVTTTKFPSGGKDVVTAFPKRARRAKSTPAASKMKYGKR